MTCEEAIMTLLSDPESRERMKCTYLAQTALEDAEMFAGSGEYAATLELLGVPVKGAVIADIGAGRGIASYAFARSGAKKVYALEPDPSNLVGAGRDSRVGDERCD